jgi:hypothetical protein
LPDDDHLHHALRQGPFVVTGPDVPPLRFKSRPQARDWCKMHYPGSPIKESGRDASKRANMTDDQRRSVYIIIIAGVLVIAAVMLKWLA